MAADPPKRARLALAAPPALPSVAGAEPVLPGAAGGGVAAAPSGRKPGRTAASAGAGLSAVAATPPSPVARARAAFRKKPEKLQSLCTTALRIMRQSAKEYVAQAVVSVTSV